MSKKDARIQSTEGSFLPYDIHPWVFFPAAAVILSGVIFTLAAGESADALFQAAQTWISIHAQWFYILVLNVVFVFCIWLMFSKYGKFRIGGKGARPEFSNLSWFAMLFSAGVGIGLLFYGVAEPMIHSTGSPYIDQLGLMPEQAAMATVYLHWGIHAWSIYAIVGLGLAFFGYTEGLPLSIRNVFYPLIGDRIYGWLGSLIDVLATVSCLYGVATSLGLGVQQINAGLAHIFGVPVNTSIQVVLIVFITAIATWSVVKGLDAGIKFLSNINIALAAIFLAAVFLLGPTIFIANGFMENLAVYIQHLPFMSLWSETYTGTDWQRDWTLFYWGWWVAWSPFVGMFIARISRGRTVREYLAGVLFISTGVTFLWLSIFGNGAIYFEKMVGGLKAAVDADITVALFQFLEYLPFSTALSIVALVVIVLFFVTSSDSGSMVIDIITAGGNPDPPKPQRIFWAITEGVVAAVLLLGGGLSALQTASIITGLPFAVVLLFMCWSIQKGLKTYHRRSIKEEAAREKASQLQRLQKRLEVLGVRPKQPSLHHPAGKDHHNGDSRTSHHTPARRKDTDPAMR